MCTKFCKTELVVFTFELFVKRVSRTMTSDSGHVWVFPPTGLVRTNAKVPVFVLLFKDGHYIWRISNTLLFIATSVLKVFSGWRFDQEI